MFFIWSKLFPAYADRIAAMSRPVMVEGAFKRAELLELVPMTSAPVGYTATPQALYTWP
jgi:hypothetical protein